MIYNLIVSKSFSYIHIYIYIYGDVKIFIYDKILRELCKVIFMLQNYMFVLFKFLRSCYYIYL